MAVRSIHIPDAQMRGFEQRAVDSYPVEHEEYILGYQEKRHLVISEILPTLKRHIVSRSESHIATSHLAQKRAEREAKKQGVKVLGAVHTHPYRHVTLEGGLLSSADWNSYPDDEFVLGVVSITPVDDEHVRTWWFMWQKHCSLAMKVKVI